MGGAVCRLRDSERPRAPQRLAGLATYRSEERGWRRAAADGSHLLLPVVVAEVLHHRTVTDKPSASRREQRGLRFEMILATGESRAPRGALEVDLCRAYFRRHLKGGRFRTGSLERRRTVGGQWPGAF